VAASHAASYVIIIYPFGLACCVLSCAIAIAIAQETFGGFAASSV